MAWTNKTTGIIVGFAIAVVLIGTILFTLWMASVFANSSQNELIDSYRKIQEEPVGTSPVIFAGRDLQAGEKLTKDCLSSKEIESSAIPDSAVTDLDEALGRSVQKDVPQNQILDSEDLKPIEHKLHPFLPDSIKASDVHESLNHDTFFTAALTAYANSARGREFISSVITQNRPHRYVVTLPKQEPISISDREIADLKLTNSSPWASVMEGAILKTYDMSTVTAQLAATGRPAIAIAFDIITGVEASTTSPDQVTASEVKAVLEKLQKDGTPAIVSTKGVRELKVPPCLALHTCYSLVGYDPKSCVVTLHTCRRAEPQLKTPEGVERIDDDTYKISAKLMPDYIRFIAFPGSDTKQN